MQLISSWLRREWDVDLIVARLQLDFGFQGYLQEKTRGRFSVRWDIRINWNNFWKCARIDPTTWWRSRVGDRCVRHRISWFDEPWERPMSNSGRLSAEMMMMITIINLLLYDRQQNKYSLYAWRGAANQLLG